MTFLHERKKWLILFVLPLLTLMVVVNVALPAVALARGPHVAEGGSPGGGEGDPEEWGSPRPGSVFFSSPPRHQIEVSFWRILLAGVFRWAWWV